MSERSHDPRQDFEEESERRGKRTAVVCRDSWFLCLKGKDPKEGGSGEEGTRVSRRDEGTRGAEQISPSHSAGKHARRWRAREREEENVSPHMTIDFCLLRGLEAAAAQQTAGEEAAGNRIKGNERDRKSEKERRS